MNTHPHLVALMKSFVERAQFEISEPERGGYRLVFNGSLVVQILAPDASGSETEGEAAADDAVFLTATLAPLPEAAAQGAILEDLLGAGYFSDEPACVYSIEQETQYVVATTMRALEGLELPDFEDWVSEFVDNAHFVKEQLLEIAKDGGAFPSDPHPGSHPGFLQSDFRGANGDIIRV